MKFSKTRIYFVIGLAMIFSIFSFGNDSVVLADAVQVRQQGSIAKRLILSYYLMLLRCLIIVQLVKAQTIHPNRALK